MRAGRLRVRARSVITGTDLTTATCITLQNPSHFTVRNMDCRDAKIGLYLRYTGGNLDGSGPGFQQPVGDH